MKKFINYETISYLVVGILTTFVYFLIRFASLGMINNSLTAVCLAQMGAIFFAFLANKRYVFKDEVRELRLVIKQFMTFLAGRFLVVLLDIIITFIAVEKFSDFFIDLFHLKLLPYESFVFSSSFTRHIIGTPDLLNQFIFALTVQVLAIVLNYFLSKKTVFKKAKSTT